MSTDERSPRKEGAIIEVEESRLGALEARGREGIRRWLHDPYEVEGTLRNESSQPGIDGPSSWPPAARIFFRSREQRTIEVRRALTMLALPGIVWVGRSTSRWEAVEGGYLLSLGPGRLPRVAVSGRHGRGSAPGLPPRATPRRRGSSRSRRAASPGIVSTRPPLPPAEPGWEALRPGESPYRPTQDPEEPSKC
jgi:hypothetical protein